MIWAEGRTEIERATGSFHLIPRITGIHRGRRAVIRRAVLAFGMETSGILKSILGRRDGIKQRDHGRSHEDDAPNDEEGREGAHRSRVRKCDESQVLLPFHQDIKATKRASDERLNIRLKSNSSRQPRRASFGRRSKSMAARTGTVFAEPVSEV